MQSQSRKLTPQQKRALLEAIIAKYERAPEIVEKALPEVAKILAPSGSVAKKIEYGGIFQLTPSEKQRREQSLVQALDKLHKVKALSKEEAIQALEDAAALVEAFPFDPIPISDAQICKLVKIATGLSVTTKGKRQISVLKEGEPSREVFLLRGVKLNLSWDKKLMSVEIDPKQMAIMKKALSIIGIGRGLPSDMAERHDEYYAEAIWEHLKRARRKDIDTKA